MPRKPNTPCQHPGCPELVSNGKYCEKHKAMHTDEIRSASSSCYGSQWRKARKKYLSEHIFCVDCLKEGKYVKATDVDHIIAHRGDQKLFWDESNWQALCHSHHSKKTNREDHYPEYHY